MANVIVATANPLKRKSVLLAFLEYFDVATVEMIDVPSNVPKQPFNQDVFLGARNRIDNLRWKCKVTKKKFDYLVAVEAGIIQIGNEWFNAQYVLIENSKGKRSSGISQAFRIPKRYMPFLRNNTINALFRKLFDDNPDGLRVISHGLVGRGQLIKDGTAMALMGLTNGKNW